MITFWYRGRECLGTVLFWHMRESSHVARIMVDEEMVDRPYGSLDPLATFAPEIVVRP